MSAEDMPIVPYEQDLWPETIPPISFNEHEALYGGGLEGFTKYLVKYLEQQRGSKDHKTQRL